MSKRSFYFFQFALLFVLLVGAAGWLYYESLPRTRTGQIVAWLSASEPEPAIFSPGISNRKFWDNTPPLTRIGPPKGLPADANSLIAIIGSGTNQECKYPTGDWIDTINAALTEVCKLPWHEAHMFEREFTDLHTTSKAAVLARTCFLLRDKLDPEVLATTIDTIRTKVIEPFLNDSAEYQKRTLQWGKDMCPWLETKDNWTAVCLANIIYATLAIEPDVNVRARVIAAAEDPIKDYFSTFEQDGYLSSGIRYWNYGFGHLMLLGERLIKATNGHINLFDTPGIVEMARFRDKWEIGRKGENAYYPLFADNTNPTSLLPNLLYLVARRFGTSQSNIKKSVWYEPSPVTDLLLNPPPVPVPAVPFVEDVSLRTYFPSAGALVARNKNDSISLAVKGGTNHEEHNHNDIGAYTVFAGNNIVCGDFGAITYIPPLFGPNRYAFHPISSFGHPLPVVNNYLQFNGPSARASVIATSFTPETDTITYDIRGAYSYPGITKLERTVTFYRGESAMVTVEDTFEATFPISFETAIISPNYAGVVDGTIAITCGNRNFTISVDEPPGFIIKASEIFADRSKVSRFSIGLPEKAAAGRVKYTISEKVN